jgi:WD40 repeat protein
VRLWDITDPRHPGPPTILTGHTDTVGSVAFRPDGRSITSGSTDATARLWDIDIDRTATRVCAVAYPRITRAEWGQYFPGLAYQPTCQQR